MKAFGFELKMDKSLGHGLFYLQKMPSIDLTDDEKKNGYKLPPGIRDFLRADTRYKDREGNPIKLGEVYVTRDWNGNAWLARFVRDGRYWNFDSNYKTTLHHYCAGSFLKIDKKIANKLIGKSKYKKYTKDKWDKICEKFELRNY